MSTRILVLGSSNIDLILKVPRFHQPGETIIADSMVTAFGGKGANQSVAAKRLGGEVCLITKIGDDHYGQSYRRYLIKNGLIARGLLMDGKLPTGVALIELNPKGENRIVVSPGANGSLSKTDLKKVAGLWKEAKVFVSQLEVPLSTVQMGLEMAKDRCAITLLNPSPPIPLSRTVLSLVDYLVPNEWEAQFLAGIKMRRKGDISKIAERLLKMGTKSVVITLGPRGVFFKDFRDEIRLEGFRVNAIDTTAAGDAFLGALACGLAEGKPIREVLQFANGAGALATTRLGAQPSLSRRKELEIFLSQRSRSGKNIAECKIDSLVKSPRTCHCGGSRNFGVKKQSNYFNGLWEVRLLRSARNDSLFDFLRDHQNSKI